MFTRIHFIPVTAIAAMVVGSFTINAIAQNPAPAPVVSGSAARGLQAPKPVVPRRTELSALTPTVKDPARHAQFMFRKTQGEIGLLFLGDSITDHWPRNGEWSWLKFAPYKPADFGISADRTEHLLWRITNGELEGIHPKVVVIMIGTNNVGHFSDEEPQWAANGVKKVVETVHQKLPGTKVLLLGVFPRGAEPADRLRQKVGEINQIIAGLDDGSKTRYLDITKIFLDAKGNLPRDIMPDALHPNAHGYDLWYEAMHPLLDEMLGTK